MIELPDLAVGGLAAGTLSAIALGGGLLRSRRKQSLQRAEIAALRGRLEGITALFRSEVEHLADRRMPAAARQLTHPHLSVPGPLRSGTPGTPLGIALEDVLNGLRIELQAQRVRIDAAAQAGMRGATREIQAALYRLQDALRALQQRYDDPELTQVLFELDHENEQSLRRAQVAAVVCGAWVGLAREESHLVDAVTGGQARLAGYHRVRVHNHLEAGTALVSHAVEPVAIIVAELLDNALRHSSPDTDVTVNLEHVHHGCCVTVDDAGLGMTQEERTRAQRLVAGSDPILLTDLGDPPRMGLAAIGQLTRQFDLTVDLSSPSPYGGVRAVLRVDSHLLSRVDPTEKPPAASAPRSTRTGRFPEPDHTDAGAPDLTGTDPTPAHSDTGGTHTPAASDTGAAHTPAHSGASTDHSPVGDGTRAHHDRVAFDTGGTGHAPVGTGSGTGTGTGTGTGEEPPPVNGGTDAEHPSVALGAGRAQSNGPTAVEPSPTADHTGPDLAPHNTPAPDPAGHSYSADPGAQALSDHEGQLDSDLDGLPRRRRRVRAAAASSDLPGPRRPARRPEEAAAALGALQSGTAAARAGTADPAGTTPGEAARRPVADDTAHTTGHMTEHTDHEGGAAR
ncbi:ATP-binding protein [Streptomyces sp. NPDC088387]|uniref:ATP-binding protein n=1 Tax=Streptomyces sp. NPDC088387 TaxID=3365859 RepID=UPI00382778F8